MRKICVYTSTRAEYGLLKGVLQKINLAPSLQLQILASGMHLSPEFGMTIQEIRDDYEGNQAPYLKQSFLNIAEKNFFAHAPP